MKVITTSSTKGGTGKSMISINLALEMSRNYKVGLLDADLDSPYFSFLTKNFNDIPVTKDVIIPLDWNGIKVVSFGNMFKDRAVSLSGDMEQDIMIELQERIKWGDIDYLLIDMPAGSSDIFKTVLSVYDNILGGLIVMLPSSMISVEKLIKLHYLYDIPVLGIIENMAYMQCGDKVIYPFGKPVGEELAKKYSINYIGQIPFEVEINDKIEKGQPVLDTDIFEKTAQIVTNTKERNRSWRAMKDYVKGQFEKLVATMLITVNKTFDIKGLQGKYGFEGNIPFALIIKGMDGKDLVNVVLRLKDGKLVVVKNVTDVRYTIETDVKTATSALLGYYKVGNTKIPFDLEEAFTTGRLKVTGPGFLPFFKTVAEEIFTDPDIRKKIQEHSQLLEML